MIDFIKELNKYKAVLTKQQFKTLRGQVKTGDVAAARKGLEKLLNRQILS